MRSRATLFLMELLIMVLVFALAAAACLQGFALAVNTAEQTHNRDLAVVMARSGAEALKSSKGDLARTARILGGTVEADGVVLVREDCRMEILPEDSGIPGLGQALVQVTDEEGLLFSLTAAWQEVAP